MRGGLLLITVLHIGAAISLTRQNRAARPVRYARNHTVQASYASRTMLLSGVLVALFVVYHLLHFTAGVTHPDQFALRDGHGRHDVYSMTVQGFRQPAVALTYVLAMLLLTLHLSHGVSSLFQSMGCNHPRYDGILRKIGPVLAGVILIGNCSMPICCLLGVIQEVRP
jgi:succinate dehydrogenase / fumarate reductase cytochrome b subunit